MNGENINSGDDARPDIRATSVWRNGQNVFFDIRVTNTNANSQNHMSPTKILEIHEKTNKKNQKKKKKTLSIIIVL